MASVRLIAEDEATGRVKALYDEIKSELGIDFVPNLYRAMASNPDYLEANWRKVKAIMFASGKLDRLTKEIIAVAVSVDEYHERRDVLARGQVLRPDEGVGSRESERRTEP